MSNFDRNIFFNKKNENVIKNRKETNKKKELIIQNSMVDLFVDFSSSEFDVEINFDYFFMNNINNICKTEFGSDNIDIVEDFLFELTFEFAKINFVVTFISE